MIFLFFLLGCTEYLPKPRGYYRIDLDEKTYDVYQNNDLPVKELIAKLNKKLVGHYRYYGVSHNMNKLSSFLHYVQRYLFKVLNRRSHKKSYLWNGYIDMLKVYPLAQPKIYVRLF